jgi:hypothetical protein
LELDYPKQNKTTQHVFLPFRLPLPYLSLLSSAARRYNSQPAWLVGITTATKLPPLLSSGLSEA